MHSACHVTAYDQSWALFGVYLLLANQGEVICCWCNIVRRGVFAHLNRENAQYAEVNEEG